MTLYGGDVFLRLARNGKVMAVTPNVVDVFGVTAERLHGANYFQAIDERYRDAFLDALDAERPCAIRYPWGFGGGVHWHELSAARLDADATRRVGVEIYDVVLRNAQSEEKLRERAERASAELDSHMQQQVDFLSHLSHELRTPLNAIIGFAQIMHHQLFGPLPNPRYISYLENIEESGFNLLGTVNDLLASAEGRNHTVALCESTLDLVPFIHHARNAFNLHSAIVADDAWLLSCMVQGDRTKLQYALHSLIAYALRGMDDGETLLITPVMQDNGSVRVTLQCRMTPNAQDSMRGDLPVQLSLAAGYMRLHGGDLTTQTIAGQFLAWLYIPADRVLGADAQATPRMSVALS